MNDAIDILIWLGCFGILIFNSQFIPKLFNNYYKRQKGKNQKVPPFYYVCAMVFAIGHKVLWGVLACLAIIFIFDIIKILL